MHGYKHWSLACVLALVLCAFGVEERDESGNELTRKKIEVDIALLDESQGESTTTAGFQEVNYQQNSQCEEDYWCWNGGKCVNGKCECLPRTSGDFCETIVGCENREEQLKRCGNPDNVYCIYNESSQEPYCRCRNIDFVYDPHYKVCKECDCGHFSKQCSLVKGKKTCVCNPGYGVVVDGDTESTCLFCSCGINSNGCRYQGLGQKKCDCKAGFSIKRIVDKCSECNCGAHGNCTFKWDDSKECTCDRGFVEKDGVCTECDCGENGTCEWEETTGEKTCECKTGYGMKDGLCVKCQCYDGEERINCTFSGGKQICLCPDGYEENKSSCVDIDECLDQNVCPNNTHCVNTPGNYNCSCIVGYRPYRESDNETLIPDREEQQTEFTDLDPKVFGCEDINECLETDFCTHNDTTVCINSPGSYKCLCKEGYNPLPSQNPGEKGCRKDENNSQTTWMTVYICFGALLGLVIIGVFAVYLRQFLRRM